MTATAADFLDLQGIPDIELLDDLKTMIVDASNNIERHLQVELGPSDVGHPCARKLALGLMREPRTNPEGDPLPSIVGTAAHTWMEAAARRTDRFLPERRVTIREGLSGTCDIYDLDTDTVIDWKFPGVTRMKTYKKHGPSAVYRAQAHLYGQGYINDGYPVKNVAICFLPRGGQLAGAHLWREPYNQALVDETLARIDNTTLLLTDLDVEQHPERYQLIPATPDDCEYCPFWSPNPTSPTQCSGG
ncbi:hypothetical protein CH304_00370 [Rhodococcus sp. 15-649-1-2]|nr:hypothetical protein [Rhodococcus sp. 15-649-1-2]OZE88059.1 hypothetical protein CH304_00370 [Rhodococcus sp. 15-649-1-2]